MNVGALLGALFFLFIGILLCIIFILHSVRLKRWYVVTGNITDSRIKEGKDPETNTTFYMIVISLSYKFGIDTYNHKDARTVYQSYVFNQASATLSSEYPMGKEIIVWCNPGKPKQYMIQKDFWPIKNIWIGILVIGAGILIALWTI
jgi:hypothetical protein